MMENQHKMISGDRDLKKEEIAVINEARALAEQCGAFIEALDGLSKCKTVDSSLRFAEALNAYGKAAYPSEFPDARWLALAKSDLQKGFMALTRAIAKPTGF